MGNLQRHLQLINRETPCHDYFPGDLHNEAEGEMIMNISDPTENYQFSTHSHK